MSGQLALGAAQFGFSYGVANQVGQVAFAEVKKILDLAARAKIDLIDTAIGYGKSEEVLGKIDVSNFNLVTKLPAIPERCLEIDRWVENHVLGSLNRLGIQSLYGLLLHKSENLNSHLSDKLIYTLIRMKSEGLIKKIGVSIYDPSELDKVTQLMQVDLVQAPLNLIDRRLETSGWLTRLHKDGVEVHTRSAFLQGLLLMSKNNIPAKFECWNHLWDRWFEALNDNNFNPISACLSYPLSLPEIDRVVVGADNVRQLKSLIVASKSRYPLEGFSFMNSLDQILINPFNWSSL